MKTLALTLLLALTSTSVFANFSTVTCDSNRGTNHTLTLFVFDKALKQVRVGAGRNSRQRAFMPTRVQNYPNRTIYTLSGMLGFMQVDNSILEGNGGIVTLQNDEFSCL
jgi:hypothetical protein